MNPWHSLTASLHSLNGRHQRRLMSELVWAGTQILSRKQFRSMRKPKIGQMMQKLITIDGGWFSFLGRGWMSTIHGFVPAARQTGVRTRRWQCGAILKHWLCTWKGRHGHKNSLFPNYWEGNVERNFWFFLFLFTFASRFVFHDLASTKIDSEVIFPVENLDLTDYISGPHTDDLLYDLQACVCHFGGKEWLNLTESRGRDTSFSFASKPLPMHFCTFSAHC